MSRILANPDVYCRVYKALPLDLLLSQVNSAPRPLTRRRYQQFYYILSCTPSCSSGMLVLVLRFVKLCAILGSANASEKHTSIFRVSQNSRITLFSLCLFKK